MSIQPESKFTWKKIVDHLFHAVCLGAVLFCLAALLALLGGVLYEGLSWLTPKFLTGFPSKNPEKAGIKVAFIGSLWLVGLTALFAVPTGIGAAIYLEEYSKPGKIRNLIQLNISNLAGVPAIVYGILGLGLFVHAMGFGRSILSGALTLSLVVLPIIIVAAQEALRSVPPSIRSASYALGATRWQTVSKSVLPAALPGMMTGVILALSRAMGEAAPLLAIGAVAFVRRTPTHPLSTFTAMPIQIYNWAGEPKEEFHQIAATGIIVLLALLICMNAVAVFIRQYFSKGVQW